MTDKEKINRHDILADLRTRIGSCFGDSDGEFESHELDENRAKELQNLAIKNNITCNEFLEITLGYLFDKNYSGNHIKTQAEKVKKFFEAQISK